MSKYCICIISWINISHQWPFISFHKYWRHICFCKISSKTTKIHIKLCWQGGDIYIENCRCRCRMGWEVQKICPIILTSSCFAFTAVCKSPLQSTYGWKIGEGLRKLSIFRNIVVQWNYSEREDVKFRRKLMSKMSNSGEN